MVETVARKVQTAIVDGKFAFDTPYSTRRIGLEVSFSRIEQPYGALKRMDCVTLKSEGASLYDATWIIQPSPTTLHDPRCNTCQFGFFSDGKPSKKCKIRAGIK